MNSLEVGNHHNLQLLDTILHLSKLQTQKKT